MRCISAGPAFMCWCGCISAGFLYLWGGVMTFFRYFNIEFKFWRCDEISLFITHIYTNPGLSNAKFAYENYLRAPSKMDTYIQKHLWCVDGEIHQEELLCKRCFREQVVNCAFMWLIQNALWRLQTYIFYINIIYQLII